MEFLKLQKDYNFDSTTVFKTTKFLASKQANTHELLKTKVSCKTVVFIQYFKNTLDSIDVDAKQLVDH